MYYLEQMMKTTFGLLRELERREKVLKRILHVLSVAEKKEKHTKVSILLMLNYEEERQKSLLEQSRKKHRIDDKQNREYEKNIQLYEEYVQILLRQVEDR